MADKNVKLQVDIETNDSKIRAIDDELRRLKQQQLQIKIDANKAELQEVETRMKNLKTFLETANTGNVNFRVDDSAIEKAEAELEALQSKQLNLQIAVADDELSHAKAEEEALNGSASFGIDVNDAAVQGAMQNIQDGVNQAKQGLGELANGFGEVMTVSGQMEQNRAFLEMNLGAEKANESLELINQTAAKMPGDDNTMRSVLSSAQALGANLKPEEMEQATGAMADYMAGSAKMGKMATETQQDLTKYLLDGNTAELERGSILSAYVDKLKEGNTFQERAKLLEEALGEAKYKGIAQQDTLLNSQEKYEGMLFNAKQALGDMFLGGTKGFNDFMVSLDGATGGLAGMALVATQEFGPGIFSVVQGLTTMVPGIKALGGLSGIWGALSTGATGFAGALTEVSIAGAPLWAVIAAIVALGVAVYEVGKYFGWWNDLPSMFEAIKAGVMELWNAFVSNEYVQQAIQLITQGLNDAWNAIVQFGQALMTALSGEGGAGSFDILQQDIQNLNTILSIVGPLVIAAINGIITYFRILYTAGQQIWTALSMVISYAMANIRGIIVAATGIWSGLQSAWRTLQSTASSVFGAINGIVSSAGGVWQGFQSTVMGAIQPIIDKINQLKDAAAGITSLGGLMSGGIETPSVSGGGGYGSGPTTVSQGNTIIFNMYGDIRDEKTLDDTIDAINSRIQFEALASGTTTTNNGGGV